MVQCFFAPINSQTVSESCSRDMVVVLPLPDSFLRSSICNMDGQIFRSGEAPGRMLLTQVSDCLAVSVVVNGPIGGRAGMRSHPCGYQEAPSRCVDDGDVIFDVLQKWGWGVGFPALKVDDGTPLCRRVCQCACSCKKVLHSVAC